MPLRGPDKEEAVGMDIVHHGEEAYASGEGAISGLLGGRPDACPWADRTRRAGLAAPRWAPRGTVRLLLLVLERDPEADAEPVILPSSIVTSWRTTSAIRRSRTDRPTVSTASSPPAPMIRTHADDLGDAIDAVGHCSSSVGLVRTYPFTFGRVRGGEGATSEVPLSPAESDQ